MSLLDYNRPVTKAALMRGESVKWIDNNKRASYIRQAVLSFPSWVDMDELMKIWVECRRLENETGIPHSLDHIIPLNHPYVCGLTVPWNLRAVPHPVNCAKGNKWHPDQASLLLVRPQPVQLELL